MLPKELEPAEPRPIHSTGEMGSLMRAKDWRLTPFGPLRVWSQSLLTVVNAMLCSPTPMCLYWGSELSVLYNDAARPIFSTKHPECLGRPAHEVWKEAWHLIGYETEAVLTAGKSASHKSVLIPLLQNGVLADVWFDYSSSAVFEGAGIAGVLNVFQDVTLLLQANRERDAIAGRLHQALDATTDGVLSIDRSWSITYMNPPARRSASPLPDAVGKNFWEAFPAARYENSPYVEHYTRAMEERTAGEFEAHYPEPLNIWVQVQVRPTDDGIVLFFRDVTAQKKASAALIQTEKLAAVGRLASSIAHEINNPLESVTNLLYLAYSSSDLQEVRGYLDTAEREMRRVSEISNQTLRFYKQSSKPRAVQCIELFSTVLSIYQGRLINSRITVEKRKRAKRPVQCFDGEIRQVLNNLVGNAIDAMHASGGRLLLRSREGRDWRTGREGLVLTVADTGEGISPQTSEKIFEAFFSTKGIGGTGLGLWVSSEIVQRHKGRLRFRSSQTEGRRGTVFQLFLPFEAAAR